MTPAEIIAAIKLIPKGIYNKTWDYIVGFFKGPSKRQVRNYYRRLRTLYNELGFCFSQESMNSFGQLLMHCRQTQNPKYEMVKREVELFGHWYKQERDIFRFEYGSKDIEVLHVHIRNINNLLWYVGHYGKDFSDVVCSSPHWSHFVQDSYNILRDKYGRFLLDYEKYLNDLSKAFPSDFGQGNQAFTRLR